MAKRTKKKAPAKLSDVLVLNRYILYLFGVNDFQELGRGLRMSNLEGYDENNVSRIHVELVRQLCKGARLTEAQLYEYDQNIVSHTQAISEKREGIIHWKYFQYMSLLFTEIYLDKYFSNKENLLDELNTYVSYFNQPTTLPHRLRYIKNESGYQASPFEENNLNKLAFWNATGSGKTLLMHVNIKQFLHYQKKCRAGKINKILLVTPNEGLSEQHLGEFETSGIRSEIFSKRGGAAFSGKQIEIIEISKLAETSGEKTVAVDAFETNNLVLIDEGHRGISGEQWKQRRDTLSLDGFAFEYSATFGQAVNAASGNVDIYKDGQKVRTKQKEVLIDEYSKSILFDYSYKFFYHDGYGKDYRILNITDSSHEDFTRKYLTGSLLAFYQQKKIYQDHPHDALAFNIENPLWVFVGGRVTKSIGKQEAADVVKIVQFISDFIKTPNMSKTDIQEILTGRAGLINDLGVSIFRGAFEYIKTKNLAIDALYADILQLVFNIGISGANVYLDNLGGAEGELGLRAGSTEDYFGVINVGDESKLWKLCQANGIEGDNKAFGASLFHAINQSDSKINLLIGAKKFTEGWSSWRVSTMGLMNIGKGEGSQIIQLFGRGVRLKGYGFSLRRSRALDDFQQPKQVIPTFLSMLETLNIFGIRANYMQRFKEYLEAEGLPTNDSNFEEITIPTMPTVVLEDHKLKIIKVKEGMDFQRNEKPVLQYEKFWYDDKKPVEVDWFPKVQMVISNDSVNEPQNIHYSRPLNAKHHAFLDWDELYFDLYRFKTERGWKNLSFDVDALKSILTKNDWYNLYIPESALESKSYQQIRVWQEVALSLLKAYMERYYNYKKSQYESKHLELRTLTKDHDNYLEEYRILVEQGQTEIISNLQKLKDVFSEVKDHTEDIDQNFTAFSFVRHLYQPLLYIHDKQYKDLVKISPVALNEGEERFVRDLKNYYDNNKPFFEDKKLFLLRNRSKKGIGFFEANNFYPDFILWLVVGEHQYIAFLDPKGLRNINGLSHPKIQFYQTIKDTIEARLNDATVTLSSFIISNTPYDQIRHWKGQEKMTDFNNYNVYFQREQYRDYVGHILEKVVMQDTITT